MRARSKKKGAAPCKGRARSHHPKPYNGLTDSMKRASVQAWEDFFVRAEKGQPRRREIMRQKMEGLIV